MHPEVSTPGGGRPEPGRRLVVRAVPWRAEERTPDGPSITEDPRFKANDETLRQQSGGRERVVGGRKARPAEFEDCVAVGNDQEWGCTGTLIGTNVVVTAGHCADFATRVFFGTDVDKLPAKGRVVAVKQRFRHPDYEPGTEKNDLMILLLAEDVVNIAPRRFAPPALINGAGDGRVVGFGHINLDGTKGYGIKRLTDVPIVSAQCRGTMGSQTDAARYRCHLGLEIVAGKRDLGKDSCRGDSGGPLYVQDDDDAWWLAGATSRATSRASTTCGDGGIYVRVGEYRSWMTALPGVVLA